MLLKPSQNNIAMIEAFGSAQLNNPYETKKHQYVHGCQQFNSTEIEEIQSIFDVSLYQTMLCSSAYYLIYGAQTVIHVDINFLNHLCGHNAYPNRNY
jgi:hypothetical protein